MKNKLMQMVEDNMKKEQLSKQKTTGAGSSDRTGDLPIVNDYCNYVEFQSGISNEIEECFDATNPKDNLFYGVSNVDQEQDELSDFALGEEITQAINSNYKESLRQDLAISG